jgi:hypothetical protein
MDHDAPDAFSVSSAVRTRYEMTIKPPRGTTVRFVRNDDVMEASEFTLAVTAVDGELALVGTDYTVAGREVRADGRSGRFTRVTGTNFAHLPAEIRAALREELAAMGGQRLRDPKNQLDGVFRD